MLHAMPRILMALPHPYESNKLVSWSKSLFMAILNGNSMSQFLAGGRSVRRTMFRHV
jgi:hypothetical protein